MMIIVSSELLLHCQSHCYKWNILGLERETTVIFPSYNFLILNLLRKPQHTGASVWIAVRLPLGIPVSCIWIPVDMSWLHFPFEFPANMYPQEAARTITQELGSLPPMQWPSLIARLLILPSLILTALWK